MLDMTMPSTPILSASNLTKQFKLTSPAVSGSLLTALDDVSIELSTGESLGIAGESGCGKSTLGKVLAGLMKPDQGDVYYQGSSLNSLSTADYASFRRTTQMIFQDPFSSLNPRMRIGDIMTEPLAITGVSAAERREAALRMLETVGLKPEMVHRFPDEFSGGQRQRIGIARALSASPRILIADEPVSSLDISIQAQIINLLQQMKSDFNLSLIMISHNLSVLRHMCDRVIIMYLGTIVESASAPELFRQCLHPYTEALLAAIPRLSTVEQQTRIVLTGDLPSPLSIPSGCRFHPRCRYAEDICKITVPSLVAYSPGHASACHLAKSIFPVSEA
jgi:peptide/nickel transport system ATP-binding protein